MGNQLTFSGSGELDNGMNVSLSFVLDQADETTETSARSPFDSHSVTVSSDSLGSLVFSGEGGSSASGAIDTTAAGDLWIMVLVSELLHLQKLVTTACCTHFRL